MSIKDSTQSRLLRISNIHGIGTPTSSDYTVNLNRMSETDRIVRCVCKSISFPNTGYNVIAGQNDVFLYEIDAGTPHTYTLEQGYYTAAEIIAILQPIIETQLALVFPGATLLMAIGPFSKAIEYTPSLGGLYLGHMTGGLAGTTGGLNAVLGEPNVSPLITAQYVSSELPDLAGLTRVFVHSTTLAEGNLVDGDVENHDIIGEVPITSPFGSLVVYQSQDDELDSINYGSARNFDQIKIQLKDIEGRVIDLHGGTTEVILKLYYF
jgi:hypothetical protein